MNSEFIIQNMKEKNTKINEAARVYKNDQIYLKDNKIPLLGENMIISMKQKWMI